jgi:predicted ATP-dependent serine protease
MHLLLGKQTDGLFNVRCGIPGIDDAMGGFQDGELIVVSGETKMGKTLLCQSISVGFARGQYFPLWFSFEVPARHFLDRFPTLPMLYMPEKLKSNAMDWFYDRCMESFLKYGTRIIFIDHLHYLIDMAQTTNASLQIGSIIRNLKLFAVANHFVIFLLCHTTKLAQGQELSYHCLRDSSIISQESDSVIMVKRTPENGETTARARVEFHRRTGVMQRKIGLIKVNGLLKECVIEEREETNSSQYKRGYR